METIIHTQNLTKHFGQVCAVDSVSISVNKGEVYGFLGLNGAGKTTTIRMLLGMIRPTAGDAFIGATRVDAGEYQLWKDVGYLVETPHAYPDLTVRENLDLFRQLRHLPDKRCVDSAMDILKLTRYAKRRAKHLSLGNAQRLGLAKALLHSPSILILDEPANGLDPAGIVEIRELLSDLAATKGVTVFISSHILGEISKFATRIGIIHEGRMLQELDTRQLDDLRSKRLLLDSRDRDALQRFLANTNHTMTTTSDGAIALSDPAAIAQPESLVKTLVDAGIVPTLVKVDEEDLESYFLRIIGVKGEER